jgi:hypothetical protein
VYGAIAYYLENKDFVNRYLAEGAKELEQASVPLSEANPDLFRRLESARQQISSKRA